MVPLTENDIRRIAKETLDKELKNIKWSNFDTPRHVHNGKDAPRVNDADVVVGRSALGSIEMNNSRRYKLGLTFNPKQMLFLGVATGPAGERVQINSVARFGTGYYFQPQSDNSVTEGGLELNVVQGGNWFMADNGTSNFRASVTEGHLANATGYGGAVDVRATIPNLSTQASLSYPSGEAPITDNYGDRSTRGWGNGFVYVDVTLTAGWTLFATFVVS